MDEARVIFLGSAAGQTATLETVSFIVEYGGKKVLVETGPNVVQLIQQLRLRPSDFSAVFITHAHADHSLGFPYLAFYKHIDMLELGEQAGTSLEVFALKDVIEGIKGSLAFHYPPGHFPTYSIAYHPIATTESLSLGNGITISPIFVDHALPTIGLTFLFDGRKKLVYSSDTLPCKQVIDAARDCNLLIHEAMLPSDQLTLRNRVKHSTVRDCATAAQESGARRLALCHMSFELYNKRDEVINEIAQIYPGKIDFPSKFDNIEF